MLVFDDLDDQNMPIILKTFTKKYGKPKKETAVIYDKYIWNIESYKVILHGQVCTTVYGRPDCICRLEIEGKKLIEAKKQYGEKNKKRKTDALMNNMQ